MWQNTLETGYYPGARHTPRGTYLVMIAFNSAKVGDTHHRCDTKWVGRHFLRGHIIMPRFIIAGMCVRLQVYNTFCTLID